MKIFSGNRGAGQQGFTLIELLVVIAILAVLAAIAIPAYSRFFGEGNEEANAAELSNIQGLVVFPRSTMLEFRDQLVTVSQIAHKLNARYVLEGTLRRGGNRIRLTAQLVDARTSRSIWAERFDREMEDIFAIQDEIAQSIARALRVMLTEKERRRSRRSPRGTSRRTTTTCAGGSSSTSTVARASTLHARCSPARSPLIPRTPAHTRASPTAVRCSTRIGMQPTRTSRKPVPQAGRRCRSLPSWPRRMWRVRLRSR